MPGTLIEELAFGMMRGAINGVADVRDQLPAIFEGIARGCVRGYQAAMTPTATDAPAAPQTADLEAEAERLAAAPVKES